MISSVVVRNVIYWTPGWPYSQSIIPNWPSTENPSIKRTADQSGECHVPLANAVLQRHHWVLTRMDGTQKPAQHGRRIGALNLDTSSITSILA